MNGKTDVSLLHVPDVLLILGTDASGKNHVTNFIVNELGKAGYEVEKREGWFSKEPGDAVSSEGKGWFDLMKEKVFLATFPLTKHLMPVLLFFLLQNDLKRFRKSHKKIIVISHTALRVLAFWLGHRFEREEDIRLPGFLDRVLKNIIPVTGTKTIVLDIDHEIRKKRIRKRRESGNADNFDLYMAKDSLRAERIENFLIWLGKNRLNAVIIENNDLDDNALFRGIFRAFCIFQQ
ncbi:MAG: hypothetical protein AB7S75_24160 [Desulfococcaceae bacterium]